MYALSTLSPLAHLSADLLWALKHDLEAAAYDCDSLAMCEIAIEAAQEVTDAIRDQIGYEYDGDSEDDDYDGDSDLHSLDCDHLAAADEVM
jgi:hypothetical protein